MNEKFDIKNNKFELLAPAGGMEQLTAAILYGADAVYTGSPKFSLRANANNFTVETLKEAVNFVKDHEKCIYVAMNSVVHPGRLEDSRIEAKSIIEAGVDAIIISDPGLIEVIRSIDKNVEIHLSTQVSTSNQMAANFWHKNGVKRVVLSRECTLDDIKAIRENCNEELELEAFVHGAMCIAYSGRCLLSSYFTGRSANCGDCAQSCRWQYDLVERKRPDEIMTIEQDNNGTYILSSKDLNLIGSMDKLMEAGIKSFKIEGRMKTAFYVATVVGAYRKAIDDVLLGKGISKETINETYKTSHRHFTTGFYFGNPMEDGQHYSTSSYIRDYDFIAMVDDYDETLKQAILEQRGKFCVGETLEIITPYEDCKSFVVEKMYNEKRESVDSAPHAQQKIFLDIPFKVKKGDILRRQSKS